MKEKLETAEQRIARLAYQSTQMVLESGNQEVIDALGITVDPVTTLKENMINTFVLESLKSTIHSDCRDGLKERLERFFEENVGSIVDYTKSYDIFRESIEGFSMKMLAETEGLVDTYVAVVREKVQKPIFDKFKVLCAETNTEDKESVIQNGFKTLVETYDKLGITGEDGNEQAIVCSTMGALMSINLKGMQKFFKSEAHSQKFLSAYSEILENPFA